MICIHTNRASSSHGQLSSAIDLFRHRVHNRATNCGCHFILTQWMSCSPRPVEDLSEPKATFFILLFEDIYIKSVTAGQPGTVTVSVRPFEFDSGFSLRPASQCLRVRPL